MITGSLRTAYPQVPTVAAKRFGMAFLGKDILLNAQTKMEIDLRDAEKTIKEIGKKGPANAKLSSETWFETMKKVTRPFTLDEPSTKAIRLALNDEPKKPDAERLQAIQKYNSKNRLRLLSAQPEVDVKRFTSLEVLFCLALVKEAKTSKTNANTIRDKASQAQSLVANSLAYIASGLLSTFFRNSMLENTWDENTLAKMIEASSFTENGALAGQLPVLWQACQLDKQLPWLSQHKELSGES